MAGKYSLEATFNLIDGITKPLEKISGMGGKISNGLKGDFLKAQKTLDGFGASIKKIGMGALVGGIAAAGISAGMAVKSFAEFDDALRKAGAIFSDLDPLAADYEDRLKGIGKASRDVAAITEFNAQQTAGALSTMAMAGLKTNQALALLPKTADLATAAGLDLNAAVGMTADTLGVFNLMTDNPLKLAENFDKVSNIMQRTASLANQDINQVFGAMSAGGAFFNQGNQSIEDMGALIDGLASRNIKGGEAGTAIRNIMLNFTNARNKNAAVAMKDLGLNTIDSEGNLTNIIDLIGQLEKGLAGLGGAQVDTYLEDIFGKQNIIAVKDLMGVGSEALRDYSNQLKHASDGMGATATAAAAMRNSIKNQFEVLKSAAMELQFKFVEAFQEKGVGALKAITEAINNFDPQPIVDGLVNIATIVGNVVGFFWRFKEIILGVAIAWGIYRGAMLVAAVAQTIMNIAMTANPIGLIITAIGLLIGLIIAVVKHWDAIVAAVKRAINAFGEFLVGKENWEKFVTVVKKLAEIIGGALVKAFSAVWGWITKVVGIIRDGIIAVFTRVSEILDEFGTKIFGIISIFTGPFGFVLSMIHELLTSWDAVVQAFESGGLIGAIAKIGKILLSGLLAPIQGLLELLAKIPGVGDFLAPAIAGLDSFRNSLKGIEAVEKNIAAINEKSINTSRPWDNLSSAASPQPFIPPTSATLTMLSEQRMYNESVERQRLDINVSSSKGLDTSAMWWRPSTGKWEPTLIHTGSN